MGNRLWIYILLLVSPYIVVYGDIEDLDEFAIPVALQEPLFVSLGSFCSPAHMLRYCGMRKAAFPFDWIISFDGEALIEILERDFDEFLGSENFRVYGPAGHLLHHHYHLEFLHDGNFHHQFFLTLEALITKYQRRIQRFRQIRNYNGHVFFIREAYPYSMTDPHRFFRIPENIEIGEGYACRLYEVLRKYFPHVKISLIIINHHSHKELVIEQQLEENIWMTRAKQDQTLEEKDALYRRFFADLVEKLPLSTSLKNSVECQ